MKLYEGNMYWPTTKKSIKYDSLNENIDTDIAIIGAGMSGILCGYELAKRGHEVVLVEAEEIAKGSSSANTGLLQYSSDKMLYEFIDEIGKENAVLFYRMCHEAMKDLKALSERLPERGDFVTRKSLYLASKIEDITKLKKEYKALLENDFPVEYIDSKALETDYGIKGTEALLTKEDAEVNPYKFILEISEEAVRLGLDIFENSKVLDIDKSDDCFIIKTKDGSIKAKKLVYATGYEANDYSEIKDGEINRTYALATEPISGDSWKDRCLIWETARPYFYARMTEDNRIILGGEDEEKGSVTNSEEKLQKNTLKLLEKLTKLFPHIETKIEYSWNAVFGESDDGIPFIGRDTDDKDVYCCLGFGGNGTVYSMAGSKIIADLIEGKSNKYAHIVSLDRQG